MTLKSLELNSFKSFGKKSVVSFTAPIISIVGPNGSGKSNIVEAIRFVLGEQSMKSLRGKGGVDLIFKGSKMTSQSSKATVTITFDNSKKIFSFTSTGSQDGYGVSLDFDEITISREVSQEGSSTYKINGTEVRLKDIVDLLASVNIGSSGHHIISQGEADRILSASLKDRRFMIEDALGLKIYQYRIKESERKLEKTSVNMKEVASLRREIAPHLSFLKKQVEKVEKMQGLREDLRNLYKEYLSKEFSYVKFETKRLSAKRHELEELMVSCDEKIEKIKSEKNMSNVENQFSGEIRNRENKLSELRRTKDELGRKLGRVEGIIEGFEKPHLNKSSQSRLILESEWKSFIEELDEQISRALEEENQSKIIEILKGIKAKIDDFSPKNEQKKEDLSENSEYKEMQITKEELENEIEKIEEEEKKLSNDIRELRQKETEAQASFRDNERVLYEMLGQKNVVTSDMHSLNFEEEKLSIIKNAFEMELGEARVLIGGEIDEHIENEVSPENIDRHEQEDTRKKIERIKIKLEDAGAGGGSEVLKEYEETRDRDEFLARELEDLNKSIDSLRSLIQELRETLDNEFKEGVQKINKQFQEFFALMFGGGSAFLSITMESKKPKKDESIEDDEEFEEDDEEESDFGFERGIEINVNLPKKKVKDLHMLSGGERSLVSIALLFAISQVNPPPFLVLDETDAALDEANSRKYADMLENLSKYSQLIVVTHNRETMSRANVLYGVTMGADGTSKLLSIKLEDATTYAK